MKKTHLFPLLVAALCTVMVCSCKKPSDAVTAQSACVFHYDAYDDPAHPYMWLDLSAKEDTVSYGLTLQITLPAEAEMQSCLGQQQTLTVTSEATAFAVRTGAEKGEMIEESYIIVTTTQPDGSYAGFYACPVTGGEGTMTIKSWNGFESDEVADIDIDITVATDKGDFHLCYSGIATTDFFCRTRSHAKNPALAATNIDFREAARQPALQSKPAGEGAHYDVVELRTEGDTARSLKMVFVMPEDSVLQSMAGEAITFTVSDEGTPFTVCPGEMNGSAVEGTSLMRCWETENDELPSGDQLCLIKGGTVTFKAPQNVNAPYDFWNMTSMNATLIDEAGTQYNAIFAGSVK